MAWLGRALGFVLGPVLVLRCVMLLLRLMMLMVMLPDARTHAGRPPCGGPDLWDRGHRVSCPVGRPSSCAQRLASRPLWPGAAHMALIRGSACCLPDADG